MKININNTSNYLYSSESVFKMLPENSLGELIKCE